MDIHGLRIATHVVCVSNEVLSFLISFDQREATFTIKSGVRLGLSSMMRHESHVLNPRRGSASYIRGAEKAGRRGLRHEASPSILKEDSTTHNDQIRCAKR